jgi:osmotically-inducible protein OsmY
MDLSQGLLMLGWLGLGLGLMYVFDPSTGKRRRALARDKAQAYWCSTGDVIRKKARDTQNRARGTIAGVRQRWIGTDTPSDTVLAARVRAQIGHVVSHAGAIGVNASQGRVSLSGPIPANEVEKILSTVASVPGVTEVVNQLEVHTDTTHISGLQNGDTTR